MRITCPNCETSYSVPDGKIGAKGREVRCARCGTRWHADPPGPDEPARPAARGPSRVLDDVDAPAFRAAPDVRSDPIRPPDRPARSEPAVTTAADDDMLDAAAVFDFDRPDATERRASARPAADDAADADAGERGFEPASGFGLGPAEAPPREIFDPGAVDPAAGGAGGTGAEEPARPQAEPNKADVESLAKRPSIKVRRPSRPAFRMPQIDYRAAYTHAKPWLGLGLFAFALLLPIGAVVMRTRIVDALPSMAGLYRAIGLEVNLRGLVFEKVETQRELDAGQQVLVVEGQITNPTDGVRPLPSIRLSLRGDDRQEIYAWSVDPKANVVQPGASVRFRTKLAAPPDEARNVVIRFTERRSRQASNP